MHAEPVTNDANDPLISVLIYNYDGKYLRKCLDSVFGQNVLENLEVICLDDATTDGSWDVALEFAEKHKSLISLCRNRRAWGADINASIGREMARGRYFVALTSDNKFDPEYIRTCVRTMESDPHARFTNMGRVRDVPTLPSIEEGPLVSILCYNYNYGRYLRQALDSLFTQTYQNIEVCFSDNASTDESWKIALEFARRYPDKMNLIRNRRNFGADANFKNCMRMMRGKYHINFRSFDVMEPEYVERCVQVLDAHPHVGLVLVHGAALDENGQRTEEPPFYNRSCIIPGHEQAAVYMTASVNSSNSQVMYRRDVTSGRGPTGFLVTRYYGTRLLDFEVSLEFDVAYIKDPLLLHREHRHNDASQTDSLLLPLIGTFVLNHQLADMAAVNGARKAVSRMPEALDLLARQAVQNSVRSLRAQDEQVALRYFHLAKAMCSRVATDPVWQELQRYWDADAEEKAKIVGRWAGRADPVPIVSCDPPPGSTPLDSFARRCVGGE